MSSLSLRHIYKIYPGEVKAVKDFNLEIEDKEFVVFVGPSGCGKSTTLRMISGLEEISKGELYIDDKLVNDVEPKDRDIAMVFQNYALYPHMTVYENMAFALKLRKVSKGKIENKVKEVAKILDLEELLKRKPKALSGGQRQRVALGRAIVREPKVFLMDEPLSNLDAKLRVQMRAEIAKLHDRLKTTFIYVTHDQTEAMTMGTKIVVMKDGVINQIASPREIYENPLNMFVAGFIGSPQMNFIEGEIVESNGNTDFDFKYGNITILNKKFDILKKKEYVGKKMILGIRPENLKIWDEKKGEKYDIKGVVDVTELMGAESYIYIKVGELSFTARVNGNTPFQKGDEIKFSFDDNRVYFFDKETKNRII
ncbi:ABC transporter ATP-binding protein [Clostridium rectalis]|uniref:ABC transporter ATP-binding protein n=1 Tax=Clostridium rectalis TaxID=2040295 RepID=UPI000F63F6A7|nr:sn-glycerol-3-phosphate ABC transporter ATP-binding protein UgpC [Clostridium rectalis]